VRLDTWDGQVGLCWCCMSLKVQAVGVGSRLQSACGSIEVLDCSMVFVALGGPRGYVHGQCLPARGQ